jgi:hypothetical protein
VGQAAPVQVQCQVKTWPTAGVPHPGRRRAADLVRVTAHSAGTVLPAAGVAAAATPGPTGPGPLCTIMIRVRRPPCLGWSPGATGPEVPGLRRRATARLDRLTLKLSLLLFSQHIIFIKTIMAITIIRIMRIIDILAIIDVYPSTYIKVAYGFRFRV